MVVAKTTDETIHALVTTFRQSLMDVLRADAELHFNQLSGDQDERLAIAAEEHAEVIQAVSKVQRHGMTSRWPKVDGPTNQQQLGRELGHVLAALDMLVSAGDVELLDVLAARDAKLAHIQQFMHYHRPPSFITTSPVFDVAVERAAQSLAIITTLSQDYAVQLIRDTLAQYARLAAEPFLAQRPNPV